MVLRSYILTNDHQPINMNNTFYSESNIILTNNKKNETIKVVITKGQKTITMHMSLSLERCTSSQKPRSDSLYLNSS